MDKDSYNIDSILSEVKKRREENEARIRGEAKRADTDFAEGVKENPAPEKVKEPEEDPAKIVEKIQNTIQNAQPAAGTPKAEEPAPEREEPKEEEKQSIPEADEDISVAQESPKDEMVNLLEITDDGHQERSSSPSKKKNNKKTAKIIIAVLLVLIFLAGGFAVWYANKALNTITDNGDKSKTTESDWEGMESDEELFDSIDETEATQLASLNDMLKTWFYNGKPCSASHVLNVLLVGEDTRGSKILDEGTRADSAIIVSVNTQTKEITLTSILRDSWAYWETTPGDESTGKFGKINGAMSTGDIHAYVNCLENLMKIDIDNYVIVNFDSFESIVDALGGVTLELTSAEINEINSHQKRYNHTTIEKKFEGTKGKQKLTGKQALAYCRIRKLDSDNKRADRQKTCLIEIFNQAKDSSNIQMLKIVNKLLPYVKTGFNKTQIVQIAKYAFTEGWLGYDTVMQNMPESNLWGGKVMEYGKQWVWKCDFPADAYNLQMRIYGKSNITLAHIRVDTKNCPNTGFYSEGAGAMSTVITNDHYGEVTTQPTTTKKSKTTTKK